MRRTTIVVGCLFAATAYRPRRKSQEEAAATGRQDAGAEGGGSPLQERRRVVHRPEVRRGARRVRARVRDRTGDDRALQHRRVSPLAVALQRGGEVLPALPRRERGRLKVPADRIVAAKAELDGILVEDRARVGDRARWRRGRRRRRDGRHDAARHAADRRARRAQGGRAGSPASRTATRTCRRRVGRRGLGQDQPRRCAEGAAARPRRSSSSASPRRRSAPKVFSIMAGFGTNFQQVAKTGVPDLGLGYAITDRARGRGRCHARRVRGDAERARAPGRRSRVAALDRRGAGRVHRRRDVGDLGVGCRRASACGSSATPSLALHLESYASYATKDHGLTFPAFVGGEVWF